MIAYDALRLLWAKLKPHAAVPAAASGLLAWLHGRDSPEGVAASSPQRALFEQVLPAEKRRWKISDLVTVGSPLTHARILFAESVKDFNDLQEQRELSTCPPQLDKAEGFCGWAVPIGPQPSPCGALRRSPVDESFLSE